MADDQFQYVKLPDGSYGKFRSDASDDVIRSAISKDFPDAFKATPSQPSVADALGKTTGISARTPESNGPLADAFEKARQWIETKATTGSQAGAGKFMESFPLGVLQALKGGAELTESPGKATKDIVGGGLQAATMPGMVMAPEAIDALPSTARASAKFEDVMNAAKDTPIDPTKPAEAAARGKELFDRGSSSLPRVLRRFTARIGDPDAGPMTYKEARDFYTNARMGMTEYLRNNPTMWRQVTIFKNALGEAVQEAANVAGKGSEYASAMKEYRQAKSMQKLAAAAAALGIKVAGIGAIYSAAKALLPNGFTVDKR